jgi:two-component system LytT family sensor kinase
LQRWRSVVAGFLAWSTYGLLSAWIVHNQFSFREDKLSWRDALVFEFSYAYVVFCLSPVVIHLAQRYRLEGPRLLRNFLIHVCGCVAFSAASRLIWEGISHFAAGSEFPTSTPAVVKSISWGLANGAPLYWIIVLVHFATNYYRNYQRSLVEAADLNTQLAKAQLKALKMQLHPHFLFNTLHAISELIHENPAGAEKMVIGLSQLLRLSLDTTSSEVPLHQELRFVELYLDIEKTRFDERLHVDMDIDPGVRDALVPYLILQPLVENSIKHGISRRSAKGQVVISARQEGESLVLRVTDNGGGVESKPLREGIGLSTTRERLEKIYGNRQTLQFVKRAGVGTEVTIRIPLVLERVEVPSEQYTSTDR